MRNFMKSTTMALGTLLVGSTLLLAAGVPGSITALDGKGMATVRTSDGKDHQVKAGQDWKVGAKLDCEMKNNAMECRPASPQAAAPASPVQPAQTTVKTAPTTAPTVPAAPAAPVQTTPAPTAPATSAPSTSAPVAK